jgi:DNA-binding protein HU-beta
MRKSELAEAIASQGNIDIHEVIEVLNILPKVVIGTLASGESIFIRGFGCFTIKKRAAKIARNISKNESLPIPAKYIPFFNPAPEFKSRVAAVKIKKPLKNLTPKV